MIKLELPTFKEQKETVSPKFNIGEIVCAKYYGKYVIGEIQTIHIDGQLLDISYGIKGLYLGESSRPGIPEEDITPLTK